MPTYEYACTSCGEHLEVSQSFTDAPLTECPNCGGPLRKVFGSIGIVLKGSGFYRTDSRAASNGKPAKRDADKSDKADKADKSDTEKKGAASSGTTGISPSSSDSKSAPATKSTSSGSSKAAATA